MAEQPLAVPFEADPLLGYVDDEKLRAMVAATDQHGGSSAARVAAAREIRKKLGQIAPRYAPLFRRCQLEDDLWADERRGALWKRLAHVEKQVVEMRVASRREHDEVHHLFGGGHRRRRRPRMCSLGERTDAEASGLLGFTSDFSLIDDGAWTRKLSE